MFEPRLRLIPEIDGQFSLLAETDVPNSFYTAGKVAKSAPKGLDVGAHVTPVTLPLKYKAKAEAGDPRTLFHRAFDLDLEAGSVLKAYVTLDGKVLGGSSLILVDRDGSLAGVTDGGAAVTEALAGLELSIDLCRAIVIQASFNPENFTELSQELRELGVIDDKRAKAHKDRIRRRLVQNGFDIDTGKVSSGPVVTVDECADSVFTNATL